ncbi:MAG: GerAB/ArcD/ProY family transporter [Bacillota bacterium]
MTSEEKISPYQLVLLLITVVGGSAFFMLPQGAAKHAGRDAWLTPIIASFPAAITVRVVAALAHRYPGRTLAQYSRNILGKYLGSAVGLLVSLFITHVSSVVLREIGEFLVSQIMLDTPLVVFVICVALAAAYAAWHGLEVLARVNQIVLPVGVFSGLCFLCLLLPKVDFESFLPFLEEGIGRPLRGTLLPTSFRVQLGVLFALAPQVSPQESLLKAGGAANIFLAAILTLTVAAVVGVLGEQGAANATFATFMSSELIRYGEFVERLDALIMVLWISLSTLKTAVLLYSSSVMAAHSLGLRSFRPLVWPLALCSVILGLYQFKDFVSLANFMELVAFPEAVTIFLLVPAILLLIATLFRRAGGMR